MGFLKPEDKKYHPPHPDKTTEEKILDQLIQIKVILWPIFWILCGFFGYGVGRVFNGGF